MKPLRKTEISSAVKLLKSQIAALTAYADRRRQDAEAHPDIEYLRREAALNARRAARLERVVDWLQKAG